MIDYDKYQKDLFLRQCIPYVIMWNVNKDFFILNRDNFFLFSKNQVEDVYEHLKKGYPKGIVGREYLYDDSCPGYMNKRFFNKMCKKFTNTIIVNELERCMNGEDFQNSYISF